MAQVPFPSREPAPAVSGPSYAAPSACHYPGANSPGFPSLLHINTVLLQSKVWREALCRGGLCTVQLRRWHQRSHSSQGLICCCSHKPWTPQKTLLFVWSRSSLSGKPPRSRATAVELLTPIPWSLGVQCHEPPATQLRGFHAAQVPLLVHVVPCLLPPLPHVSKKHQTKLQQPPFCSP